MLLDVKRARSEPLDEMALAGLRESPRERLHERLPENPDRSSLSHGASPFEVPFG